MLEKIKDIKKIKIKADEVKILLIDKVYPKSQVICLKPFIKW